MENTFRLGNGVDVEYCYSSFALPKGNPVNYVAANVEGIPVIQCGFTTDRDAHEAYGLIEKLLCAIAARERVQKAKAILEEAAQKSEIEELIGDPL